MEHGRCHVIEPTWPIVDGTVIHGLSVTIVASENRGQYFPEP